MLNFIWIISESWLFPGSCVKLVHGIISLTATWICIENSSSSLLSLGHGKWSRMLAYIHECKNPQSSVWSACWIQLSFYYVTILFYRSCQGSITPGTYNVQVYWVDHSWSLKQWWSPGQVGIDEWKEQHGPRLTERNKIQWFPKGMQAFGKTGHWPLIS